MPQGQEKSGKTKKKDKSQVKIGVLKKSGKVKKKLKKTSDFVSSI